MSLRLPFSLSSLFAACLLLTACISHQQATIGPGSAPAQSSLRTFNKTVPADATTTVEGLFYPNPDCTSRPSTIHITQQPVHGTAAVVQRDDYPNYPPANPRSACNKTKMQGSFVEYTPQPGFTGSDFMAVELFSDTGQAREEKLSITVK